MPSESSFGKDFWRRAKESPTNALAAFYGFVEQGHARNDPQLVERAYCGMALVYALCGNEARATERIGQARVAAARRGNMSEVEQATQQVALLLSNRGA